MPASAMLSIRRFRRARSPLARRRRQSLLRLACDDDAALALAFAEVQEDRRRPAARRPVHRV